jgi:hypothetical protein
MRLHAKLHQLFVSGIVSSHLQQDRNGIASLSGSGMSEAVVQLQIRAEGSDECNHVVTFLCSEFIG